MFDGAGSASTMGVWLVSLLTGLNGALVQIIMASRVAYGMAENGQAPIWLAAINSRTRTPLLP
jgi:APA family basic amino acid/polyamine antiporter